MIDLNSMHRSQFKILQNTMPRHSKLAHAKLTYLLSCAPTVSILLAACCLELTILDSVNGIPTCADNHLLDTILRKHWQWEDTEQWISSDCDSIENIYIPHGYSKSPEEAVAAALNAGVE
jgi:hypothetical protein